MQTRCSSERSWFSPRLSLATSTAHMTALCHSSATGNRVENPHAPAADPIPAGRSVPPRTTRQPKLARHPCPATDNQSSFARIPQCGPERCRYVTPSPTRKMYARPHNRRSIRTAVIGSDPIRISPCRGRSIGAQFPHCILSILPLRVNPGKPPGSGGLRPASGWRGSPAGGSEGGGSCAWPLNGHRRGSAYAADTPALNRFHLDESRTCRARIRNGH
jgi:hypothetical protein